ncbi:MAG TPA: YopX family protein [Bacillota bacterium]|nr:YopX family protein [Bacillota bacterium]
MSPREYRIWCKNNKEWERDDIAIKPNGFILHMNTRKPFPCMVRADTHIIEFFTGLHDTTTKKAELWENDIVEHGEMPYQVVWNEEQGYWAAHPLITTEAETMLFWLIDEGDCVKVGNIHENPELLK